MNICINLLVCIRLQDVAKNMNGKCDTEIEEGDFDILFLCNEELEECVKRLDHVFESFQLKVTINLLDVLPGASNISGMYEQCRRSKHFVLVIDENPIDRMAEYYFKMIKEIVSRRNYGQIVVIKTNNDVKIPSSISKYPNIEMNFVQENIRSLLFELGINS